MSADNYLLIRKKPDGWYVFERKLSITYPKPDDAQHGVTFDASYNPDGRRISGPHDTDELAYDAACAYAEETFVEYGIEFDDRVADETPSC